MSVLDDMTKGITDRKARAAGPTLTPVGVESSSTKPSMPLDVPNVLLAAERLVQQSAALKAYAAELLSVAEGLDIMAGLPEPSAKYAEQQAVLEVKLAEQAADRRAADRAAAEAGDKDAIKRVGKLDAETESFAESFAAKQVAAQAAVYTGLDDGDDAVAPALTGWTCPEHGTKNLVPLVSRANRKYTACAVEDCNSFER